MIGLEVAKNFKPSKWQQRQQQQQQQKQAFGRIVWAFSLEKFKQTLCSLSHSVFCTIWLFFSLFVNVCYRWNIEWIEWREKYAFQSLQLSQQKISFWPRGTLFVGSSFSNDYDHIEKNWAVFQIIIGNE